MARELPARPNLEYLKNQAKDLLGELQRSNPDAQLADAQFALAREYGFGSWPTLKSHVETVTNNAPPREHLLAGVWSANVAKSKHNPVNPVRSATVHIAVVGDKVTLDDVVIDEAGREERHRNELYTDGQEHPSVYGNGYVLRATWFGSRVLEVVGRQNNQGAGRVRYEVSADGQTLTVSDPSREHVSVFDRQ